ncbi:MAG TPA: DUF4105 domain-containing protein, partial [Chryseolinea sp.]|nr:DUF4105 domain-containing protein [Chryseolinea sp.]
MKLLFKAIFIFPLLIIWSLSQGQSADTSHLRISLITCGPADELYSIWGHTAIRVTDSSSGMDVAFNYGTFDNSDPYFYLKFTRGIMQYALSVDNYTIFLQEYKQDHRSVIEQKLMLNGEQKERLLDLLKINALEENRYYNYRFYEDNCTTRAKGIINKSTHNSIFFKNILTSKAPTYRELIHKNLDSYHQYWSKFAIDFLLGSNLDKQITNEQSMFLPDYLMQGFDSATLQQHPLVSENKIILKGYNTRNSMLFITPFNLFSLLALFFIFLSFSKKSKAQKVLRIADAMFFFSLGLLGILILFVWAGRVDSVCKNNLNVLWAWPTHIFVVFLSKKKHIWIKNYF